jgi:putative ABC transport system ATP-binding protein
MKPKSPEARESMMILLDGVHLTLASEAGAVNVLRGVSLKIGKGETVALVGPSGSGKSTLMMVIGGLERANSGSVAVAGRDFAGLGEDDLARLRREHIGIVFQSFHLMPAMTALENVALPLELAGWDDAAAAARETLAAVGLSARERHYPAQLSGGEQQRVAIARAFVSDPGLILADEPTGNLDGETGRKVMDLLFGLAAKSGTTLLLITHDRALARRCGRILSLEDGRITADERSAAGAARAGKKRQ